MREIDGAHYVVTCPRPTEYDSVGDGPKIQGRVALSVNYFYDRGKRTGGIFRNRDGKWEKLIEGLDDEPQFGSWKRPWAQNAEAIFVGARGSGPWILPKDAKESLILLDWKQRFPLAGAADFCLTTKGDLLCLSATGETAIIPSRPDRRKPLREVAIHKTVDRIWRDKRGHLWMCTSPLAEWDGTRWIGHPLPPEIAGESGWAWLADDRDRGWIYFDGGRVAICEFGTAKVKVFESLESALEAQLLSGIRLPNLDYPFLDPAFSGDGRCAFFSLPDRVNYFDGANWLHWKTRDLTSGSAQVAGAPYFDETGKLCFPLGGYVHQWEAEEKKWIAFSDPLGPTPSTEPVEPSVELPEGSGRLDAASVAQDTEGHYWIVTPVGELKKMAPGMLVSAFFQGEAHPFRPEMKLGRVLIDARGGAWLELSGFGAPRTYVYIQGFDPPDTQAELVGVDGDVARLRFSARPGEGPKPKAEGPAFFSWQLDGGPWQRLTGSPDLTLPHLAVGRHRLLVRAYGASLNVDPTPATVEWQNDFDAEAQHRALLAELPSPALARREAAAKALREQGDAAVPFLRKARETAPEELRWWIDAILQKSPANR